MGHGYPTSSYDFYDMVGILDTEYYICTADYIGYGFSEKPQSYTYDMFEHAEVIF